MAPNDQSGTLPEFAPPQISLADRDSPLEIAVIGSGIAGLSAAWLLAHRHRVVLYERDGRPGGHSNTVDLEMPEGPVAVDTGFIVFNDRTYPNLTALFAHLGVKSRSTDMSFAASVDGGNFEYSGTSLAGLFAQRRNLMRPRMWRMIRDIMRFYREARCHAARDVTLGEYLATEGYDAGFVHDHLLPMGGAIWSTSPAQMLEHPLGAFVRFCDNHGLLQVSDRPVWRTVAGGSRQYVQRLLARGNIDLQLNARIADVRRASGRPEIRFEDGNSRRFDAVVLAAHADQSLALLAEPTVRERHLLGAMRYIRNEAVLHGDASLMPRRPKAWSSWNVMSDARNARGAEQICVTYWMNRLQHLATDRPVFVTLNPHRAIAPEKVWARFDYAHPLFDAAAVAAQKELWSLQGAGGVWFCGAYFGAGFHEDGLQAGLAVAEQLGHVRRPWLVAEPSGRIHAPLLPDLSGLLPVAQPIGVAA